jgi:hypothetical protein
VRGSARKGVPLFWPIVSSWARGKGVLYLRVAEGHLCSLLTRPLGFLIEINVSSPSVLVSMSSCFVFLVLFVLSFLSCLVLSCLVLSCLVLSCLVLSCLVLSCLVIPRLVLSLSCSNRRTIGRVSCVRANDPLSWPPSPVLVSCVQSRTLTRLHGISLVLSCHDSLIAFLLHRSQW